MTLSFHHLDLLLSRHYIWSNIALAKKGTSSYRTVHRKKKVFFPFCVDLLTQKLFISCAKLYLLFYMNNINN